MLSIIDVIVDSDGVMVTVQPSITYATDISYTRLVEPIDRHRRAIAARLLPPVTRPVKLVDVRSWRCGWLKQYSYTWQWADETPSVSYWRQILEKSRRNSARAIEKTAEIESSYSRGRTGSGHADG